jgi:opacity protein-like surface antigen
VEAEMTKTTKVLAATLIGLASLVLGGRPASAEWFADIFAGLSFTESHDLKLNDQGVGQSTFRGVDFDTSLSGGGRFGHYFDSLPFLGLAVDFFHFSPNISPQSVHLEGCFLPGGCGSGQGGTGSFDITETALSVDLMLRLPLMRTADAPHGLLQPYIAVGRPLFITTVTPRNTRLFRNHDSDTDLSFGYKAAGGLAFQVYTSLVLFVEYRFTHVSTDVNLHDAVVNKATLRTELNTHSALFGISARW